MLDFLRSAWPWYVGGPLLGLMVPLLLFFANKHFGVSSSFRHICAATLPLKAEYFKYNWKDKLWSLVLIAGIISGAAIAVLFLDGDKMPQISAESEKLFTSWGISRFYRLQPAEIFAPENVLSLQNLILLIAGGFLVGFGARYAGGCTSGHAIMGLSLVNIGSLFAVLGFFAGGIIVSRFILPLIFRL